MIYRRSPLYKFLFPSLFHMPKREIKFVYYAQQQIQWLKGQGQCIPRLKMGFPKALLFNTLDSYQLKILIFLPSDRPQCKVILCVLKDISLLFVAADKLIRTKSILSKNYYWKSQLPSIHALLFLPCKILIFYQADNSLYPKYWGRQPNMHVLSYKSNFMHRSA